jgi:2-C-methyl-D-erythritol 4-phosphate cytidylyltransferase
MEYQVVIPAAGSGTRMGAGQNKLFLSLSGLSIIIRTLRVFEKDPWCKGVVLVIKDDERAWFKRELTKHHIQKVIALVTGGAERQHSVYLGLKAVSHEFVLIHDGARPLVSQSDIHRVVQKAKETNAAVLAVPVKDTIKRVNELIVTETVERQSLWAMQTPQAFRLSLILKAHALGHTLGKLGTDDAELVEGLGESVHVVLGNYKNIKITTKEDLIIGEQFLLMMDEGGNGL